MPGQFATSFRGRVTLNNGDTADIWDLGSTINNVNYLMLYILSERKNDQLDCQEIITRNISSVIIRLHLLS